VIGLLDRNCRRHRPALLELLDGRRSSATAEALLHLDRCSRCEEELSLTALTLAALRRLAAEARRVQPPSGGWHVVRSRIERPPSTPWAAPVGLAKSLVSVGVLLTVMTPVWLSRDANTSTDASPAARAAQVTVGRTPRPAPTQLTMTTVAESGPRYEKGPTHQYGPLPAVALKHQPAAPQAARTPAPAPTIRAR
jgi:predicted anti-sigma-YlaC factor YlaD